MRREWKPGAVAMVTALNRPEPYRAFYDGRVQTWRDLSTNSFCVDKPTSLRPLVVIDPEDFDGIGLLLAAYSEGKEAARSLQRESVNAFQVALREFLNPPKPDEPTGLGAVVEDDEGNRWVRVNDVHWHGESSPMNRQTYGEIAAVRVLSEGVTP